MITIDSKKMTCTVDGQEYLLTATENKVLAYLDKNRDRVVPKEELKNELWGVDSHVKDNIAGLALSRITHKVGKPVYRVVYRGGYILL